jgi:hypothetical protein
MEEPQPIGKVRTAGDIVRTAIGTTASSLILKWFLMVRPERFELPAY